MKKTMAWLLTALMALSLLGCGGGSGAPGAAESAGMTVGTPSASGTESAAGSAAASTAAPEPVPPPSPPAAEKAPDTIVLPPDAAPPVETVGAEKVRYTVTRDAVEETIRAADGTRIAEVRYTLPLLQAVVEVDEEDVILTEENSDTDLRKNALAVTAAFNAGFDEWRKDNETLKMYAEGDFAQQPEMFREMGMYYADALEFTAWQTDGLVSIRGSG